MSIIKILWKMVEEDSEKQSKMLGNEIFLGNEKQQQK